MTTTLNGYILAVGSISWMGNNVEADFRLVIDGVAGDATHQDTHGITENLTLNLRSGALLAGAHVIKVQVRRTNGNDGVVEHVDLAGFSTTSE